MAEDIDKLVTWARSQGWTVVVTSKGYRHFYTPNGTYVGYYPNTPSRPGRRWKRLITDVTRAGLPWPPPSKSERRAQRRKDQP